MSITPRLRGGVYVDGFNLYHAIDDLCVPYLKWLGLWRLSERFAKGHAHSIEHLVFCTAFFPSDFEKRKRHEAYNAAQESFGAKVMLGHTTREPQSCKSCFSKWDQPREKETDINVALSIYEHVTRGLVDVVFLVTADTDQAATLRFIRDAAPQVRRVVVTPPGRQKSKHLKDLSHANLALTENDLDLAVMPATLIGQSGRLITRPREYAPPLGWVHPDERPK